MVLNIFYIGTTYLEKDQCKVYIFIFISDRDATGFVMIGIVFTICFMLQNWYIIVFRN
jgi:hypothetical protein